MDRATRGRLAAVGCLLAGGLLASGAGELRLLGLTGGTVGLGLLAAGLALAVTAERADGDRRATLLLALAGACCLLATRVDAPGRYGAAALAAVAAAGALYRGTLADHER
ncbi:hypothetical protein [Haloglomus litoreum]|uniref:hypothetical protein n=1 Tax=Haloglomus litoreum TaxID=3034026 RepID=UPI0023E841C1|nr:hypothetical protein [Haloglomus sp. DT116]